MRWSKKALMAKIEATYGTDSVPVAGTNDVLLMGSDVSLTPIAGTMLEREIARPGGAYGSFHQDLVGKHVLLQFSVEMAGSGTPATPAHYGPLLRACGMSQTVVSTTNVDYVGIDDSQESVSIYLAIDGTRYKVLGAMGDVEWTMVINQKPMLRFSFMGLFTAAADASFPAVTYTTATSRPLAVTDVNTPTFSLHSASIKVASFSARLGNTVEYRELVNDTRIVITGRKTTGQVTFEQVLVATKDWGGIVAGHTLGALSVVHGLSGGNICEFTAANVQLSNPRPSGSQDQKMITLDMAFVYVASAVEFRYTTK